MSAPLDRADVVIVGGGAVGASTAFHLTELGITDVVLVEREVLGAGSTSKAAGGIRLQFGDELNVRIAQRSLAQLGELEARVRELSDIEIDVDLRQPGYLFLLDDADDLAVFRTALATQQALGVPARELTVDEVGAMLPQLTTDDLIAATYCPLDGRAVPEAVVQGYAAAATARGARVRQGCEVTGIELRGDAIAAVQTSKGRIETSTVVCAAGIWSKDVAAHVGVELPVHGEAHWLFFSREDGGLPADLPVTIDFTSGFYVMRETHGILFGGRAATIEELAEPAVRRLPLMTDIPVQSSWWGWYDMSPDCNAIVGEAVGIDRFLFATGFSGHGFQQAPAVGEHLAELIAGRATTLDLSALALERFARGESRREHFYI
ncbi:MAG: FAD-binding oxidoreductase [Conexibacter sp.]